LGIGPHSSFFSSPKLSRRTLDVYHTSTHGVGANLECRSDMCCTWLMENTGHKKSPKIRHLGTIPQLCYAVSAQVRHVSTIRKKLVKHQYLPQGPIYSHNMVNFGPLAAEIDPVVWGTPANFNRFSVLAALLHGTRILGVSHTLRR